MAQFFPKPYEPFGGDINVKTDLSKHVKKNRYQNYVAC